MLEIVFVIRFKTRVEKILSDIIMLFYGQNFLTIVDIYQQSNKKLFKKKKQYIKNYLKYCIIKKYPRANQINVIKLI